MTIVAKTRHVHIADTGVAVSQSKCFMLFVCYCSFPFFVFAATRQPFSDLPHGLKGSNARTQNAFCRFAVNPNAVRFCN